MKLKIALDQVFQDNFKKFKEIEGKPALLNYYIAKISKKISEEVIEYVAARNIALEQYAQKDENGKCVVKDQEFQFPDPAAKEKFVKEMNALEEEDFEISKISVKNIINSGISVDAACFEVLEPIFSHDLD